MSRFCSLLLLFLTLTLAACVSRGLNFQISYDDVNGLKKGAPVVFEGSRVGHVEKIQYTDQGNFLVSVNVEEQFSHIANQSALFYITAEEVSADRIIEVIQTKSGNGSPIAEDQVVPGTTQIDGMAQKFRNQFGDALSSFSSSLKNSFDDWKEQTLEQQIGQLEQELDRLLADMEDFSADMKEQYQTEILPRLEEQIELLKRELHELGRDDEIEGIEKRMDNLNGLVEA